MPDGAAAHCRLSVDGYRAINSRTDFKKAAKAMITCALRQYEGQTSRTILITILVHAARSETAHLRRQMIDPAG